MRFNRAAPIPTPTCGGSQYVVKPGDTLESVSIAQKVATDTLLNRNGLSYDGFPANGTLCIENTCTVYVVKTNDTCQGIASVSNVTTTQLFSWNTNINPLCNNLENFVNSTLCVSNPLGNFAMPTNTIGGSDGIATTPA
jgi:spore germination protein YaaH